MVDHENILTRKFFTRKLIFSHENFPNYGTCLLYFFINKIMLIFGYKLQCIEAGCLTVPLHGAVTGFTFDRNFYAIHGSPYTSAHILIENTLAQHKMAKNSCMALCCQNWVSKGTNQRYGLHYSACISVHSALVMVLGLLKKKKNLELVNCRGKMCHNEGIMWKERTRKPHPNPKP